MLYRKMFKIIDEWYKNNSRHIFVLEGVRQAGKSFLINEYLKNTKKKYHKIDLIENSSYLKLFSNVESANDIEKIFTIIFGDIKDNGEIIFIDECQEFPNLLTYMKYMAQNNKHRYILSGSLLGIMLKDIKSIPIGYAEIHTLYPLDFEEYLISTNTSLKLIEDVKKSFINESPIDELIHEHFLNKYYEYLVIGGMPEAINSFLNSQNYTKLFNTQQQIINLYKLDFTKYTSFDNKLYLNKMYDFIPSQLQKDQNNRFNISEFDQKKNYNQLLNTVKWFKFSGVAYKINAVSELSISYKFNEKNLFKLYLNDIGLLVRMLGTLYRNNLVSKNYKELNMGMLFENFAATELIKHGFIPNYFKQKKNGEIEFIVESKNLNSIIPIEIKSGNDYLTHKSLDFALNKYKNIKKAYVFCDKNIKTVGKIIYAPIYTIMFLENI